MDFQLSQSKNDDNHHRHHHHNDDHDNDEEQRLFLEQPLIATTTGGVVVPATTVRSVSHEYQQCIPETQNVFWNDDFFDDQEDVIAVFDFDIEGIVNYKMRWQIMMNIFLLVVLCFCVYIFIGLLSNPDAMVWAVMFGYLSCTMLIPLFRNGFAPPFYVESNLRWKAKALHVAITREGIELVQSRRKAWCGFVMCDVNTVITKIPRDTILRCDVLPPDEDAGGSCGFGRETLYTVFIETETAMKIGYPALRLVGLRDPYGFKTVLSAVKRHTFPPAEAVSSEIPQSLDADQQLEGINSPSQIEIV